MSKLVSIVVVLFGFTAAQHIDTDCGQNPEAEGCEHLRQFTSVLLQKKHFSTQQAVVQLEEEGAAEHNSTSPTMRQAENSVAQAYHVVGARTTKKYVYFEICGGSGDTVHCAHASRGSAKFTNFAKEATYSNGVWSCGKWSKGNPMYDIRITQNSVEWSTTETDAVGDGPVDCEADQRASRVICPDTIKFNITTTNANLCVPSSGGTVEYIGKPCDLKLPRKWVMVKPGIDKKYKLTSIQWISAKALDLRDGLAQQECQWTWTKDHEFYAGSCGKQPKVDGGNLLPTYCTPKKIYAIYQAMGELEKARGVFSKANATYTKAKADISKPKDAAERSLSDAQAKLDKAMKDPEAVEALLPR